MSAIVSVVIRVGVGKWAELLGIEVGSDVSTKNREIFNRKSESESEVNTYICHHVLIERILLKPDQWHAPHLSGNAKGTRPGINRVTA